MSTFWSIWVTVITLIVIFGCAAILYWCVTDKMGVEEGESMGHSFDGIEEMNTGLPKWWTWLFVFTIVISLLYMVMFPSIIGGWNGLLNWTSADQNVLSLEESKDRAKNSHSQYQREMNAAEEKYGKIFKAFSYDANGEYIAIEKVAENPDAVKVGQRLFLQNCAQCHGSDARGGKGFPNLADGAWLYGGDGATIKTSIMAGRHGIMPAKGGMGDALDDEGVKNLTAYVLSLSGRKVNALDAQAGKQLFAVCSACHGADGTGVQALGGPDLTDNIWLYGGSRKAVEETILHGRVGVMPAWKDLLGEDKVHIIASYVYSLSNKELK